MQRTSLVVSLALGMPAAAQEKGVTAEDLPSLRAAFTAAAANSPRAVAIACVPGRAPVILTSGTDASDKELSPKSLLPLLGLAKVLAADAMHSQLKDRLDKGTGYVVADHELTLRELLDGTALLPDFFVLDGGAGEANPAQLHQCAQMAASARLQLRATKLGAAEFVLLEGLAFGRRYKDWGSMIRSTLAPRVPGLDPLSAGQAPPEVSSRLALAADDVPLLAAAKPELLRTMLSLKDLATWWQWRAQQEAPLWASARMGRMDNALTMPKERRWTFSSMALNSVLLVNCYPAQKAALVWFAASRTNSTTVQQAFEADLFPAAEGAGQLVERALAGGVLAVPAPLPPAGEAKPSPLAGSTWRGPPRPDFSPPVKLEFAKADQGARESGTLTLGADTVAFPAIIRTGDGWAASGRAGDGSLCYVWLRGRPDADQPTGISAVILTTRTSGKATSTGGSIAASVPQYLELTPVPN